VTVFLSMFNCFYSLYRFCSDVCYLLICTFDTYFIKIFRISYYYKCSPDSESEISLEICQYLTKLRRTKQIVPVFWPSRTNGRLYKLVHRPNDKGPPMWCICVEI